MFGVRSWDRDCEHGPICGAFGRPRCTPCSIRFGQGFGQGQAPFSGPFFQQPRMPPPVYVSNGYGRGGRVQGSRENPYNPPALGNRTNYQQGQGQGGSSSYYQPSTNAAAAHQPAGGRVNPRPPMPWQGPPIPAQSDSPIPSSDSDEAVEDNTAQKSTGWSVRAEPFRVQELIRWEMRVLVLA